MSVLHAVRESRGDTTSSFDEVNALLETVKQSRFAPAQTPDGVVAVNMVWLLARTTVKASIDPNDPGTLAPLTGPDEVVKPLSDGLALEARLGRERLRDALDGARRFADRG